MTNWNCNKMFDLICACKEDKEPEMIWKNRKLANATYTYKSKITNNMEETNPNV